jgi:hypothetical protein
MLGEISSVSRSTPVIELSVLINDNAFAPAATAARAGLTIFVMLGVSLTITGIRACSMTQRVICSQYSGTWPTAAPIPRSLMPCGQP